MWNGNRLDFSLSLFFSSHLMSDYWDEHPILVVFCLAVVSLSREIVEFPLVVCLFPGIVANYFYYCDRSCFFRASTSNWDMFRFKSAFRILFFSSLDRVYALEHLLLLCIVLHYFHYYRMQSILILHEWMHCFTHIDSLTWIFLLFFLVPYTCLGILLGLSY